MQSKCQCKIKNTYYSRFPTVHNLKIRLPRTCINTTQFSPHPYSKSHMLTHRGSAFLVHYSEPLVIWCSHYSNALFMYQSTVSKRAEVSKVIWFCTERLLNISFLQKICVVVADDHPRQMCRHCEAS